MDDADITMCVDACIEIIGSQRLLSRQELDAVDHARETLQEIKTHIYDMFLYGLITEEFSKAILEKAEAGCQEAQRIVSHNLLEYDDILPGNARIY